LAEEQGVCIWCFVKHKEGTKVKRKHERYLKAVVGGSIPCNLGDGCRSYLCVHKLRIIEAGLNSVGNCNELLSQLPTIRHFLEVIRAVQRTEEGE